jgi:protein SCO1/2
MGSGSGTGETIGVALDARLLVPLAPLEFEERLMKTCQMQWLLLLVFLGCKDSGADRSKDPGEKEYDVCGKVVSVDAAKPVVTLDHEDIPGLMKAMEMEFEVKDPKLLEGIKAGDRVQGRLRKGESGYVLTRLEKQAGR